LNGRAILVVSVAAVLFLAAVPALTMASTPSFTVVSAQWGTTAKPVEAQPGSTDIPLTVTLQFTGSLEAKTVQGALQLAAAAIDQQVVGGLTDVYGNTTTTAFAGSITTDATFSLTYYLDVTSNAHTGVFSIPLEIYWTDSSSGTGYYSQTTSIGVPILGIPTIVFGATQTPLAPGKVNNVSLTIGNEGSGAASKLFVSLSSSGASALESAFEFPYLSPGQSEPFTVGLYVPAGSSGSQLTVTLTANYVDAYGSSQSVNQQLGLYVGNSTTPSLNFKLTQESLLPGQTNSLSLTLTNLGKGSASGIKTQITAPSQISILTQFPFVEELQPGSSVSANISLYASSNAAGMPLSLSISSSYTDQYGQAGSASQSLGIYVISNSSLASDLIAVVPRQNEVNVGDQTVVSFLVKNIGTSNLTSPILSLAVSSSLVVTSNSTFPLKAGALRSGQSVTYDATVAAGTSASPGYYTATLTVSYIDQSGNRASTSVSTGLVLSGNVIMVLQSTQVTQGNSSLAVSGSILNEGFSNAYYATVTGSLAGTKGQAGTDYIGEVDTNTLIPFSVTINYIPSNTPNQKVNVTVSVSYEDSLGLNGKYTVMIPTTLKSIEQLLGGGTTTTTGSSSGSSLLTYLEFGVIAIIAVVAIVGAIYVRRNRAETRGVAGQDRPEGEVI